MVTEHDRFAAALGAWALGICEPDEARAVEVHLDGCAECRSEVDEVSAVVAALPAGAPRPAVSPALRSRIFDVARMVRPPAPPAPDAAGWYRSEVVALEAVLSTLAPDGWQLPTRAGLSVRDLVVHLTANDARLGTQLHLDTDADRNDPAPRRWRAQADALLAAHPTQLVRLTDSRFPRRTYADALVQRAFETWVHAADISAALGTPERSVPAPLANRIATLGVDLLPWAFALVGVDRPGRTVDLRFTDGGEHRVAIVPAGGARGGYSDRSGAPDAVVTIETAEFCALMGNRRTPATLRRQVEGDPGLAADLLRVVSTLGCE
ncbi:maleylpyruvate isomerase family mycothiol-dependent enzyme [Cryptosporangium aurantiacum]|uniref:TIGR03083 family protein n=1 Tax=Cryptosporangium aurantiacum TaxID=134849 RepID=A0A1M7RJH0_9ACTN|nr:maleylpyruvate isomerase family mycothiol-dependent enzyme [Cryptosporangium aurantiacum]SHN46291.1 TIGR03083 family protein [Cryptosporangium aurantiacum]